ncbi:MAG: outer membrane beta-barrel protein [bacterium]
MFEQEALFIGKATLAANILFAIFALIYGHVELIRSRKHEKRIRPLTPYQFVCEQLVLAIKHPKDGAALIFGAFLFPLSLLYVLTPVALDMRRAAIEKEMDHLKELYREKHNMDYRVSKDDRAHVWQRKIEDGERLQVMLVRFFGELCVKTAAAATLLLSIVFAPLMFFVKSARAGEKPEEDVPELVLTIDEMERPPIDPRKPDLSGAMMMLLHADSQSNALSIMKADVDISGKVSPHAAYLMKLAMASSETGGATPVIVANAAWVPSKNFSLTVGRYFTSVGLSRLLPPHLMTEVSYVGSAITAPLVDQGLFAKYTLGKHKVDFGLVTGDGMQIGENAIPDAHARVEFASGKASVGASGQTGPQAMGWRHNAATYAELDMDRLLMQAELAWSLTPEDTDTVPRLGWWYLVVWKSEDRIEPYARIEALYDLREDDVAWPQMLLGMNYATSKNTKLRGAALVPLENAEEGSSLHIAAQITF